MRARSDCLVDIRSVTPNEFRSLTTMTPVAVVVIPTHNRASSIVATLDALDRQDCPIGRFEVVVVANACTDDTMARVDGCRVSYPLRAIAIEQASASLARNTGASNGRAPIVIFLDDDIMPDPWFVKEHVAAHEMSASEPEGGSHRVVMGYLPARLQPQRDWFAIVLRGWWEAMFDRMRDPGHRFAYSDLLSGNFSMSRDRFLALGGFDTDLQCHEDYELGYRLIAAGAQFVFAERASGTHADETRLPRACHRKREEGAADVKLATRYPELRPFLLMSRPRTFNQRVLRMLAFHHAALGDRMVTSVARMLRVLERIGATSMWMRVVNGVLGYWYERGLADALGTRAALDGFLAARRSDSTNAETLDIDLTRGLEESLRCVERIRPSAVALRVGPVSIGTIPLRPGAERLAARHVAAALVRQYHRPCVEALLAQGCISFPIVHPDACAQ